MAWKLSASTTKAAGAFVAPPSSSDHIHREEITPTSPFPALINIVSGGGSHWEDYYIDHAKESKSPNKYKYLSDELIRLNSPTYKPNQCPSSFFF